MHSAINRVLNHIELYGLSSTFIKIIRLILRSIVGTIINLLLTFLLLIIRPLVKVKILNVSSERIGHLGFSTDLFLRKIQLEKDDDFRKTVYIGMCQIPAANDQLLNMFARNIPIIKFPLKSYFLIKE